MNKNLKILFFGTQEFALFQLKNIIKKTKHKIVGIVTKKEKKKKIFKKIAKKYNLNIFQPKSIKKLENLKNIFKKLNIDIILTVSYGFILPKKILQIPKISINLHASLLPRWRGSSPIQKAILSGDKFSGITFIKMNKKIDAGKIIYQKKCLIKKNYNYIKLYNKLKKIGAKKLPNLLQKIANNNYNEIKQNKKYITYSNKINKKEGLINWKKDTAINIERKIKAFYIWPKTYFFHKKYIIFIWSVKIKKINKKNNYKYGEILKYTKKGLQIFTKKSHILKIKKIQLNNRKKIKISQLINSKPYLFNIGDIL